jgi:adenine-specific DNA methylase
MESVAIVNIRDMIFENALQGIVLLLAVKRDRKTLPLQGGKTSLFDNHTITQEIKTHLEIIDINGLEHLKDLDIDKVYKTSPARHFHGDWMRALLTDEELQLIERITAQRAVKTFVEIADVDIGIVTGANDFFVVNTGTQQKYQLEGISTPMLAKSDLIAGINYTIDDHKLNEKHGRSVHFLSFPAKPLKELPSSMAEYLKLGEAQNLHTRYKCRIREPWYVVPYVWVAELSLLKRCHLYPRIVLNEAHAYSTDTAYRIKMLPAYSDRAKDLTFSFLNSLSFLHAEMLGRHYGGGVLELVPSEIERIPIPLISASEKVFTKADKLIRNNTSLDELLDFTDGLILKDALGLSQGEIEIIRKAHKRLLNRRLRR